MKKILLMIGILFIYSSCKDTDSVKELSEKDYDSILDTISETNLISMVLEKQLKQGSAYDIVGENSKLDLMALLPLIEKTLYERGYKPQSDFEVKARNIFYNADFRVYDSVYYANLYSPGEAPYYNHHIDGYFYDFFVDYKRKFITEFYFIPMIIDYTKMYPELLYLEEKPIMADYDGGIRNMPHWKDIDNPYRYRKSYVDALVHRNKYLFNGSKASLTWLINNDIYFLRVLVKDFGYDSESRINRVVLDYYTKSYNRDVSIGGRDSDPIMRIEGLFAAKDNRGNIKIREGLMKTIVERTTLEDNDMLNMLMSYGLWLLHEGEINFTDSEKMKIAAYVGYYIQQAYNKCEPWTIASSKWYPGSFFRDELYNEKFMKNLKDNSYYNLPGLEDMIEYLMDELESDNLRRRIGSGEEN